MKQGSEDWYRIRAGRITGSRFARAMAKADSNAYAGLVAELVEERRTGRSVDGGYVNDAMQWGMDHEAAARRWYAKHSGQRVAQTGFVIHPTLDFVGVSPDGLVGTDGLIEIKCPQLATFERVIAAGAMPSRYRWQVQGQMWVCQRQWLDFVCFHPPGQGITHRITRDDNALDRLEARCIEIDRLVAARLARGRR